MRKPHASCPFNDWHKSLTKQALVVANIAEDEELDLWNKRGGVSGFLPISLTRKWQVSGKWGPFNHLRSQCTICSLAWGFNDSFSGRVALIYAPPSRFHAFNTHHFNHSCQTIALLLR